MPRKINLVHNIHFCGSTCRNCFVEYDLTFYYNDGTLRTMQKMHAAKGSHTWNNAKKHPNGFYYHSDCKSDAYAPGTNKFRIWKMKNLIHGESWETIPPISQEKIEKMKHIVTSRS